MILALTLFLLAPISQGGSTAIVQIREGQDPVALVTQSQGLVLSAKPLFPHASSENHGRVRARFPRRSARISQNAMPPNLSSFYKIEVDASRASVEEISRLLEHDPRVRSARPNFRVTPYHTPNDPFFSSSGSWGQPYGDLWNLKNDKIQAELAWDQSQGEGILIAIVDSGLDLQHPDLAANLWINPGEDLDSNGVFDPGEDNGVDDDGNGFVDDFYGWDFWNGDALPVDDMGHGTHVAGIAAAVGENNEGIVGVAYRAKVMAVKVIDPIDETGFMDKVAQGVVYATDMGADVINVSLGCDFGCPSNPLAEAAVQYAHSLGVVIVLAAGNGTPVSMLSPQNMTNPKPIVVGASNVSDQSTWYSSPGTLVDLAAPGGDAYDILSLKAAGVAGNGPLVGLDYMRLMGTSMATPHVTGAVALMLSQQPNWTPDEIRQILRASVDDIGEIGTDLRSGTGRLNANRALTITQPLEVKIQSPATELQLIPSATTLAFTGTVNGNGFVQYQLFYRNTTQALADWTPIEPPVYQTVIDGDLGMWSLQGVAEGIYLVKVEALSSEGYLFSDAIKVTIDGAIPIATSTLEETRPAIWRNRLVFQRGNFAHHEIVYYDTDTQSFQIVSNTEAETPSVWGDWAVWRRAQTASFWDILAHNLVTGAEILITNDNFTQSDPCISGDWIVWQDHRNGGNPDIYSYSLRTGIESPVATGLDSQQWPRVSQGRAVWSAGGGDVFVRNLPTGTTTLLTPDSGYAMRPDISENRVLWQRQNAAGHWDLFVLDQGDGTTTKITTDAAQPAGEFNSFSARISGTRIVWADQRNGQSDIYWYDMDEGVEHRLTFDASTQFRPNIWNRRVVWEDWRSGNPDVYMHLLPNKAPLVDPIPDYTIKVGRLLSFKVHAEDPDLEPLTLSASNLPSGAIFDPATGVFSWKPNPHQAGTYPDIQFTASDGDLSTTETVTITVKAPSVISPVH